MFTVFTISRQIRSVQNTECEKQVQEEVDIEEDGEIQAVWSSFVHQIEDAFVERYTPYVPYDSRDDLVLCRRKTLYIGHVEVKKSSYSWALFE